MLIGMFLLFTLIFSLATICFIKIAHFSIQRGQWFDLVFKWQDKLDRWYKSGGKFQRFMTKVGGDCPMCFAHLLVFISFWCYVFFTIKLLGFWITDLIIVEKGWRGDLSWWGMNIIWYIVYVSITLIGSVLFITKTEK